MAIYKQKIGKKHASFRQGLFWGLWGFVAGVYCFQPLLKLIHRDEKSILSDYITIEGHEVKSINRENKGDTKKQSNKPDS